MADSHSSLARCSLEAAGLRVTEGDGRSEPRIRKTLVNDNRKRRKILPFSHAGANHKRPAVIEIETLL
jgi:hypothetical protein